MATETHTTRPRLETLKLRCPIDRHAVQDIGEAMLMAVNAHCALRRALEAAGYDDAAIDALEGAYDALSDRIDVSLSERRAA